MNWTDLVYRFASAWREALTKMLHSIAAALIAGAVAGLLLGVQIFRLARAEDVVWYKPMPGIIPAPATGFGLYRGADFQLTKGACKDCAAPKQALWYFRDEVLAVPADGVEVADFTRGMAAQDDVRRWYATATEAALRARPPLLWIGATHLARDLTLTADDELRFNGGHKVRFEVVPKIRTNLSYYDDSSRAFFRKRPLRMRGELNGQTFVARTIWPQDWTINEKTLHLDPLLAGEGLMTMVRRHASARNETFETRLLWERTPEATRSARNWSGRAVIGIMLNGAQGDDDEAHGGHFAIVTGRHQPGAQHGDMADWIVNNFYNLDSYSEKGITAAMLPLDNYMADLNSGQSWYRPSYMLVAVLKNDRAAYAYQAAIARVYGHFYRHDFLYSHAGANCAGISMDTLRSLGWNIPMRGPTSRAKAILAYPYKTIAERSFASGKQAYDYLIEEQTRLYPAAAYEAAGHDLLRIAREGASAAAGTGDKSLEKLLREDVEAIVFVRLPQLPSSRAFGSFPVSSYDEYMRRVPADKSQWKIVPVDARPFPAELVEADTLRPAHTPPWLPAAYGSAGLATLLSGGALLARRRRRRHDASPKS